MFKPLEYAGGLVWGAVSTPFKWLYNGIGNGLYGAFNGALWGGSLSVGLHLIGGPVLTFVEGLIPSLGKAQWYKDLQHYIASSSIVDKLKDITPAAAAAGGALGLASAVPQTIAESQQVVPQFVSDVTGEKVTVTGWESGQNHGAIAGALLAAAAVAVTGLGIAKQHGLIGSDGASPEATPVAPTPVVTGDEAAPVVRGGAPR